MRERVNMLGKRALLVLATGSLALTIGLAGCGSSQPAETKAAAPEKTEATDTSDTTEAAQTTEATGSSEASNTDTTTTETAPATTTNADSYIGDEAAKTAALKHAGLSAADCTELEAELDLDDATVHYDVDFKSGGMEYDYDIDAVTGDVLAYNVEADD